MNDIDDTITRLEKLYRTITGLPLEASNTAAPYALIPPERDPVRHVEEQIDRLLRVLAPQSGAQRWTVPITVSESVREYLVVLDVPGVHRESLEVSVQGNTIVVTGQRSSCEDDGHRTRVAERPFGAFRRVVPLPPDAKAAEMSARLHEGVLEIRVSRNTEALGATPRTVPVA